jgi:hypothetical protein
VGSPGLSAEIRAGAIAGVVCRIRFSPLRRGDYFYDVELYVSVKMFTSA